MTPSTSCPEVRRCQNTNLKGTDGRYRERLVFGIPGDNRHSGDCPLLIGPPDNDPQCGKLSPMTSGWIPGVKERRGSRPKAAPDAEVVLLLT